MQLDSFAGAALKNAEHSRIRLQAGFFLGEQTRTGERCNDGSKKKCVTFHDQFVVRHWRAIGQQNNRGDQEISERLKFIRIVVDGYR